MSARGRSNRPTPLRWPARAIRWAFHQALIRALRAPRLAHDVPLQQQALQGATLAAHRVRTAQGLSLAVWHARPLAASGRPAPCVLVMHGWGANAAMMWPVVQPLLDSGWGVVLLDARCHGQSDDDQFTSLPRFAEDIGCVLDWLVQQASVDATRIALLGHSVGAAACLLRAAQHPRQVAAVVSLSAFAHPAEVMQRWLTDHHLPQRGLGSAILHHVQQVIGARFDDIAPLHTVTQLTVPVLLVHGLQDETIPFNDAERLCITARRAGVAAQLMAVDGPHDLRQALVPQTQRIAEFLSSCT